MAVVVLMIPFTGELQFSQNFGDNSDKLGSGLLEYLRDRTIIVGYASKYFDNTPSNRVLGASFAFVFLRTCRASKKVMGIMTGHHHIVSPSIVWEIKALTM
jgi:hypothetical protein